MPRSQRFTLRKIAYSQQTLWQSGKGGWLAGVILEKRPPFGRIGMLRKLLR
jgi:hypothetical protein